MSTVRREDAHRIYRRYVDAVVLNGQASAEAAGLHTTDLRALSVLDLAGSLTSGELAERTGLTTGATTRLIDRLERRGLVRRAVHPADRRKVIIEPVAGAIGGVDVEAVAGPARRRVGAVLARYTPEQLDVLFDYFEHAATAYHEATEELRSAVARPAAGTPEGAQE